MRNEKENLTIYDSTERFNDEIRPLLDQINIKMKAYRIPFFFCAAVRNGEKKEEKKKNVKKDRAGSPPEMAKGKPAEEAAPEMETVYECEGNFCESNGIVLADDKMTDFLRVACGFKVSAVQDEEEAYTLTMPEDNLEMDYVDEGIDEFNEILAREENPA